jgi:hypothetical protein
MKSEDAERERLAKVMDAHGAIEPALADAYRRIAAILRGAEPNLLEALEWITAHYADQDINHVDFRVEACRRAQAAIAKATGVRPESL